MPIDLWRWGHIIGGCFLVLYVARFVSLRTHWLYGCLFLWALCSALFLNYAPISIYPFLNIRIGQTSGQAVSQLFIMSTFGVLLMQRHLSLLSSILQFFACLESILIILLGFGLLNSTSFGGTFIACSLPLFFFNKKDRLRFPDIASLVLCMAGILASKSATAIFCILASLCVLLLYYKRVRYFALIGIILLLTVGYFVQGTALLDNNDRVNLIRDAFVWWGKYANYYLGTGSGSFEWLGPIAVRRGRIAFFLMHNEFLQILFEQGIIGLTLFVAAILHTIRVNLKRPDILMLIAPILVSFLTQFPLRFFLSQLLCVFVLRKAFEWKERI